MRRFVIGLTMLFLAGLVPVTGRANDQRIVEQIETQLSQQKASGELRGFSIDLEVDHGTVWLKGYVSSADQQDAVLDAVRRIRGVQQVVNDLEVKSKRADSKIRQVAAMQVVDESEDTDENLAGRVIQKLQEKKDRGLLQDFDLDVEVSRGSVWLTGEVASEDQLSLVLDTARRVKGVKQIVNDLQLANTQPVARQEAVTTRKASNATPLGNAGVIGSGVKSRSAMPTTQASVAKSSAARSFPRKASAAAPTTSSPNSMRAQTPRPYAPTYVANRQSMLNSAPAGEPGMGGAPMPAHLPGAGGVQQARYDHPSLPNYAWPSYAAYPNYGQVSYPRQYSPSAWPYIGPFYPYPQVPLGWRKVMLEWDDGWWFLDFKSR